MRKLMIVILIGSINVFLLILMLVNSSDNFSMDKTLMSVNPGVLKNIPEPFDESLSSDSTFMPIKSAESSSVEEPLRDYVGETLKFVPQQVHVTYSSDSSIWITWSTKQDTSCLLKTSISEQKAPTSTSHLHSNFIYKVELSDLPDDSSYSIECNGQKRSFEILPKPKGRENIRLAIVGDWSTSETKLSLTEPYTNVISALYELKNTYWSIWHLGDIAYDLYTNDGATGDDFLNDIEPIVSYQPYMPIPGNHEKRNNFQDFKERFANSLYYRFNIGTAAILAINNDQFEMDEQIDWLRKELGGIDREEFPWVIVMGHKPLYCTYHRRYYYVITGCEEETALARELFEDIFVEFKVDLYFSAHIHLYERTLPLKYATPTSFEKNFYVNPDGVIHIVNASAENLDSGISEKFLYKENDYTPISSIEPGYGMLDIWNQTHLGYTQYGLDGSLSIVDSIMIIKSPSS